MSKLFSRLAIDMQNVTFNHLDIVGDGALDGVSNDEDETNVWIESIDSTRNARVVEVGGGLLYHPILWTSVRHSRSIPFQTPTADI